MKKEVGPGGSVHQSKQGTLRQGWMREREREPIQEPRRRGGKGPRLSALRWGE